MLHAATPPCKERRPARSVPTPRNRLASVLYSLLQGAERCSPGNMEPGTNERDACSRLHVGCCGRLDPCDAPAPDGRLRAHSFKIHVHPVQAEALPLALPMRTARVGRHEASCLSW